MIELLPITDATIRMMLADARYTNLIPCLASINQALNAKLGECGRCHAKKQNAVTAAMAESKNCLTSLPADKRGQLKQLLNAKKLRVTKKRGNGTVVVITF